jgi:DNA-binding GntR family transcriptional regulator
MATIQTKPARRNSSVTESRRTLADGVIERIRQEIISGWLAPGTMVAEIPTAQRLNVSRVPVREAMMVLEHDGLLEFEENGRCRVRTLTARDFDEIYSVRLMLETEAFRLAALNHTDADLKSLRDCIRQMERARSLSRVTLLDIEFHDRIMEMSRQSRLRYLWKIMRSQIQLFTAILQRELSSVITNVRDVSVEAHLKCLLEVESGVPERAGQCAIEHLEPWSKWLKTTRPEGGAR